MLFRARQFEFRFPRPALVMGIVNVTPDSFSDGGKFLDPHAAVARALDLVAQGADILDIGGESSRPGAEPVAIARNYAGTACIVLVTIGFALIGAAHRPQLARLILHP